MAELKYENFDLLIERAGKRYRARVSSLGGDPKADFNLRVSELKSKDLLTYSQVKEVGELLFKKVFAGEVQTALQRSIDHAETMAKGLRVRLRLTDVPELAVLPWEYLYDPERDRFLALSDKTPLVRYLDIKELISPLAVKSPLKLLAIISSPSDYEPQLDVNAEWTKLREATANLERQGRLTVERLEEPTLPALQRRLRQGEYHILHYHGHAAYDEKNGEGVLILEGPTKQGKRVNAQSLATLLRDETSLRLVILNACEGARSSGNNPFAGTAQTLVQQGIPAVIAMQFKVTDAAAINIAHEFYASLADGLPVDTALTEGRKAIFNEGNRIEWGFPVLYMRSPDGQIFDVQQQSTDELRPIPAAVRSGTRGTNPDQTIIPTSRAKQKARTNSHFIGRETELQELLALLSQGVQGEGSSIFVEARAGMGTSTFLKRLQELARQSPELEQTTFVSVYCNHATGSENAYQPFTDILSTLADMDKNSDRATLVRSIVHENAPSWVQLIPDLAPTVGLVDQPPAAVERWLANDQLTHHKQVLAAEYLEAIGKIASQCTLLVVLIEDAHWIDDASCQLLLRLARVAPNHALVVIVTYRPEELGEQHHLRKTQQEMASNQLVPIIPLQGWNEQETQSYVQARYGRSLNPKLAHWLQDLCKGNPLFVTELLNVFEREKIICIVGNEYILDAEISNVSGDWELMRKLEKIKPPRSVNDVLNNLIGELSPEDKEMLQAGSVQGQHFTSAAVVALLNKEEPEVLEHLHKVVDNHGIIQFDADEEWAQPHSEAYVFEHLLMQQSFYSELTPTKLRSHHRRLAELLDRTLKDELNPRGKLILEIAYHYERGGEAHLAARYYYRAAESYFSLGAFLETAQLCQKALEKIRTLSEGVAEYDRLRAEIIQLRARLPEKP